jgi:hypothetical protein
MGTSIPNLFPYRFQESIFHLLTRLQIPAQLCVPKRFLDSDRLYNLGLIETESSGHVPDNGKPISVYRSNIVLNIGLLS